MKRIWRYLPLVIVFSCVFCAGTRVYEYLRFQEQRRKPFPNGLPNSDIVFMPFTSDLLYYNQDANTLGFINSDGSDYIEYRFPIIGGSLDMINRRRTTYKASHPRWSRDGNTVFFRIWDSGPTNRAITSEGYLIGQDCYLVARAFTMSNANIYGVIDKDAPVWEMYRKQVLPNTTLWARISLEECAIRETFLLSSSHSRMCVPYGETNDERIVAACTNLDNNEKAIIILAKTGHDVFSFPGTLPSLSDDGGKIAYYGEDGSLRVRDLETGEDKKLIVVPRASKDDYRFVWLPGWSPDGKWLVYNDTAGQIYKINIDTREQLYLVDGWAPDWK